jgi:hypothetical protein
MWVTKTPHSLLNLDNIRCRVTSFMRLPFYFQGQRSAVPTGFQGSVVFTDRLDNLWKKAIRAFAGYPIHVIFSMTNFYEECILL